jgi:polyhydroxyalkanoate synthase subunit PhaC
MTAVLATPKKAATDKGLEKPATVSSASPSAPQRPDYAELARQFSELAAQGQRMSARMLSNQAANGTANIGMGDPMNIGAAFLEATTKMLSDPVKLANAQLALWQSYMELWQSSVTRFLGGAAEPVIHPAKTDKRFKDPLWQDSATFDFIKQAYLLSARWVQGLVQDVEGLDAKTARKVDFYTRQLVDALAPTNYLCTNPEALRTTLETGGKNLLDGMRNLLEDLERGQGKLKISMTDYEAFEVGKNIATTPGKVVFQNDLMQLIQYSPSTPKVAKRPLLVIPPWINKFYILDLRENNSFIKWAVDQGQTVFVISWANPSEALRNKTFENYMFEGPLAALDAIAEATGEREINTIGYCIGGTLLACLLSWMHDRKDTRIASATFFTTLVDFSDPGELSVFIDEEQLTALEARMQERGYLDGAEMATTFNLLRANDLIWSFVVNNYLLGKEPFPFDLLYWNADATRMPAPMHSFYLRKMYQDNALVKCAVNLDGVKIDLTTIKTPAFLLSTVDDHIAPWKSTYAATQLYKGPVTFCLSGSGHIAGVINPPSSNKYGYWTSEALPAEPDAWLKGAAKHEGSWWPAWGKWLSGYAGGQVDARVPGSGKRKAIEDAPGSYVKVRY